eukprot:TRINITY_DN13009_c0_g1_i1.p1 TRINITY_DN13009_c0_g1~~TRINITY_DN13009_c0_g1_i1.p1  ORF type:complete len:328 (-),score=43.33 TRINITY_DN13009_c0_g1_i1:32-943(-)
MSPLVSWADYPFVVLILGVSKTNTIEHVCTGSILNTEGKASHILTTAYCIQNKTDPQDPASLLKLIVLVPNAKGTVPLEGNNFTEFAPFEAIIHPGAGTTGNFSFLSAWPNGTAVPINAVIDVNDVGILRLTSLINVTGARPVSLGAFVPQNGTRVDFLGFGGPAYYSLRKSDSMAVIPSIKIVNGVDMTNSDLLFYKDVINSGDNVQAVEIGDEGGPVMVAANDTVVQVAIGQGTWRMGGTGNDTQIVTFASLGPAIAPYQEFIREVMEADFVLPTDDNQTASSSSHAISMAVVILSVLTLF